MHKRCGDQDASSKMTYGKEEACRKLQEGESGCNQRKSACQRGHEKDDKKGTNMKRSVVFRFRDAVVWRAC